jgi:uncharacterized protein YndB with AHSA1/START domain
MSTRTSTQGRAHEPIVFTLPSAVERQVSRIFRAPPERVFRLFTDPATMPYVFSPNPESVTIEKLEFRKGGHYRIAVKNPDGSSVRFQGEFREIDPPRRVVNTFEVDAFPGVVSIETDEFEPVGDHTRLTVRWTYQRPQDRDTMAGPGLEQAVTIMWNKVDELLEQGLPKAARAGG